MVAINKIYLPILMLMEILSFISIISWLSSDAYSRRIIELSGERRSWEMLASY